MAQILVALASGLLFGLGLIVSGMTNPAKVQNFLDLFGTWDPSLAFVMGGGLAVNAVGYWLIVKRRSGPLLAGSFNLPTRKDLDRDLIVGAGLFGIGWGLVGFCPGPVLTATTIVPAAALPFLAAMLVGMLLRDVGMGALARPKPADCAR
jgi:uncharacterized membrane protein YedE/YeeE